MARSAGHAARAQSALGECRPLPSSEGTVGKVNTLMAEHRETASPQTPEDLLRDSERQLRLVAGNGPVAIAHCDTEARYKLVNKHYAEGRGLTPEQVAGKRIPEAVGGTGWAIFEPYFR